jgi:serine/threonine-protein kinase
VADPSQDKPTQLDSTEQQLANFLTELVDEVNRGLELDLESICRQYPQFAQDLRQLWGTLLVAQSAGSGEYLEDSSDYGSAFELPFEFAGYQLEEEIGRGGMGIVYRARRLADGQIVAIKMILKGDFASPAERQRFQAEAQAAARLSHPNIVPIYQIGEHRGHAFFCMPLITGATLSQLLLDGPLPPRHAAQILLEVCAAIRYAHSQGVFHRDLKPSNILIDTEGTSFVVDFGLAKQTHVAADLTKSGAVLGTPSYMAPEQAAGTRGQVGGASDIYSLGAILYHMLTGRPPFLGATSVDTVLMVLEQDPIPPRVLNRRVDRGLELIAMRCLQKPQDLRYASAEHLHKDLSAFLNHGPISAEEGRLAQVIANVFRETHHASVLENWGLLWMWHSLV